MSRYEPPNPIKQKEREDLLEKVREMTSEESKGGKGEKSMEVDTDLSWDHEGLRPLPKAHKDRLTSFESLPEPCLAWPLLGILVFRLLFETVLLNFDLFSVEHSQSILYNSKERKRERSKDLHC